jgi:hypothetical protein
MIKVEGKINGQPIAILIDSRASHSYLDLKMMEGSNCREANLEKLGWCR